MNNMVYAFIKELKEQHVTLRINSVDETVKLHNSLLKRF